MEVKTGEGWKAGFLRMGAKDPRVGIREKNGARRRGSGMRAEDAPRQCDSCGVELRYAGRGRPRRYCTDCVPPGGGAAGARAGAPSTATTCRLRAGAGRWRRPWRSGTHSGICRKIDCHGWKPPVALRASPALHGGAPREKNTSAERPLLYRSLGCRERGSNFSLTSAARPSFSTIQ